MIIAVDFDGTLVESAFPEIGKAMPEALLILNELQVAGHKIILWTCRTNQYLEAAVQWLNDQGFIPDAINESLKLDCSNDLGYTRKVYADIYIDDRNLDNKASVINWQKIKQQICELENKEYNNE